MQSRSANYISTLTPLRGIAAILIVIYHCNFGVGPFLLDHTKFLQNATLCVDFFFVLSGFIISYVYHDSFRQGATYKTYKKYLGARFARIYPLHFVTTLWAFLGTALILHYASSIDPDADSLTDNLRALPKCLLLLNVSVPFSLNVPSWSLCVEWWMYMVFPLFVPMLLNLRRLGKFGWLTIVLLLYCMVGYGPYADSEMSVWLFQNMAFFYPMLKCMSGFLLGMLLYTVYEHRSGWSIMRHDLFFVLSILTAVVTMHLDMWHILSVACFPFIILSASYNAGLIKRFFDTRVMQSIGNWSFSIYLIHSPLISMYFIFKLQNDGVSLAEYLGKRTKSH